MYRIPGVELELEFQRRRYPDMSYNEKCVYLVDETLVRCRCARGTFRLYPLFEQLGYFELYDMASVIQCETGKVFHVIQLGGDGIHLAPEAGW